MLINQNIFNKLSMMKRIYQIVVNIFFKFNVKTVTEGQNVKVYFCYFLSIVLLSTLLLSVGGQVIDFIKTTLNLYLKTNELIGTSILIIAIIVVITYCFFKSTIENFTIVLRPFKIIVKTNLLSKVTLLVTFIIISSTYLIGNSKIKAELYNRVDDIYKINRIISILKENKVNVAVFASKIPTLYRKADLDIQEQILPFEELALTDNKEHIAIIPPNSVYKFLLSQNYKYYKISDTSGILVQSPKIITILQKKGYIFSDFYYTENFNLSKLARVNRLKFVPNKGIKIESNKPLLHTKKLYLLRGKYHFEVNLNLQKEDYQYLDNIGYIKLTASDKLIVLFEDKFNKKNFEDGYLKYNFDIEVSNNYHDVEIEIQVASNVNLYLSSVKLSKVK